MRFHRKTFFDRYRAKFGSLAQLQVDGLNFLLDKIEADSEWKSIPQIAYFLATVKHETGIMRGGKLQTFQPIKELRGREGTKIRKTQDKYWGTGAYGRGFVQITWPENYSKFGLHNPEDYDRALDPEVAYDIAARGMRKGMFTKFKLSDFVNGEVDYYNARQVVNGLDKYALIAGYAETFEVILREAAKVAETEPSVSPPLVEKEPKPEEKKDPPVETVSSKPPVVEVKNQGASWTTKIAAGASAITPVLTATGLKIGGIELSTGALYAFAAIAIVGLIVGGWIYNEGQKRAFERQKLSMENMANPNRGNVVAQSGS